MKKDKVGACRTEKGRSSLTERPMSKEVRKARRSCIFLLPFLTSLNIGLSVQVITLWQIVAILYCIPRSTGNQCPPSCGVALFASRTQNRIIFTHTLFAPGSLANKDEQLSSPHAELCLPVFEGYQLTGHYSNLNESVQEIRQELSWPQW